MTERIVVDASAAASWLLPSQATARSDALAARTSDYELVAPQVLLLETRNFLLRFERQTRASGLALEVLKTFAAFRIDYRAPLSQSELDESVTFALRQGLGFFDAMYVQLALDARAPLATRDGPMISVAQRLGVSVLDLR